MLASDKIRRASQLLGFGDGKQSGKLLPITMCLLGIAFCIDTIYCVVRKKSNGETVDTMYMIMTSERVNAILSSGLMCFTLMFTNSNIRHVLRLMELETPKYKKEMPESKMNAVHLWKTTQLNNLNKLEFLVYVLLVSFVVIPALVVTYYLVVGRQGDVNIRHMPLLIPFYFPDNYDVLALYFAVYICQSLYMSYIIGLAFLVFASLSSSFESVIIHVKTFCFDIKYMNTLLSECKSECQYSLKLCDYATYLIRSHQRVRWCTRKLSECESVCITIANQGLCFHICAFLYCATEANNKLTEYCHYVLALSLSLILLVYCRQGQNMINAGEEIKDALYNCPWLDKPHWFKKNLQIMITNLNVPLHVKPHGLYVLDLNNFTSIMNASYSFYNLLRSIKQ